MENCNRKRTPPNKVKREARVLVILGNPPYNAFAGVSPEEEQGLVEPYKEGLNKPTAAGGLGNQEIQPRRPVCPLLPTWPSGVLPK